MKILDACCGSKMFWFDKNNPNVTFMDIRKVNETLSDGRKLNVNPDLIGDFRNIPFPDNTFDLVVFDPPHLLNAGDQSWLAKKYGKLNKKTWKQDISRGFDECMRVLKVNGILIFKWNEEQVKLSSILSAVNYRPLFGNRRAKTHWLVFYKTENEKKVND